MRISDVQAFTVRIGGDDVYMGPPEDRSHLHPGGLFQRPHYPIVFAKETLSMLVRIETDSGLVGWGEAQAPIAPEATQAVVMELVRNLLIGRDPCDVSVLWHELFQAMRSRGHVSGFYLDAVAACDIALWDLFGQQLDAPISTLLGGAHQTAIPVYASGIPTAISIAERVEAVEQLVSEGFRAVKLKLGMGVAEDIANVRAVRESVPDVEIMVDVHWRYSVHEALRLGEALGEFEVAFIESPLWSQNRTGLRRLATESRVPIAGGEELRTRHELLDLLLDEALDIVQPDVGRSGITELVRIAHLVDTFHKRCAIHVGVGLGIYLLAGMHCAAVIPNLLTMEHQPLMFELSNQMFTDPLTCHDGYYELPTAPGLGRSIDLDRLRDLGWQISEYSA